MWENKTVHIACINDARQKNCYMFSSCVRHTRFSARQIHYYLMNKAETPSVCFRYFSGGKIIAVCRCPVLPQLAIFFSRNIRGIAQIENVSLNISPIFKYTATSGGEIFCGINDDNFNVFEIFLLFLS